MQRTVEGINATHELTVSTAKTMDDLQRSVGEINQILADKVRANPHVSNVNLDWSEPIKVVRLRQVVTAAGTN